VGEGGNDRDQVGEGENDRDRVGEGRNDRDRAGASEDPGGETVLLSAPAAGERAAQDTATGAGEGPGHDGGPEGAGSLDRVNAGDEPAVDGGREPLRERLGSEPGSSDGVPIKAHEAGGAAGERGAAKAASRRTKPTPAGALIWVLLALLGFTLVVQLRSNNDDQGLASARQEDLVSILSDLESRDSRLQGEITSLEQSQRQLTSGVSSRQAALAEAQKRSDELGLLAGTLPGKGPGLKIMIDKVKASSILNAVEELRGSGGEVMELAGDNGATVRIVASSYFVDAQGGGILVDGVRLTGPWTLWVIGPPQTMQPALQIQGGVVASVQSGGGSVTMEAQTLVQVTAVRKATTLQYAHPAS
jgi:uncharacterized protein YlxW (UPF0749 family)